MIRLDSQDEISGGLEESCMCTCRRRSADVGNAGFEALATSYEWGGDGSALGQGRVAAFGALFLDHRLSCPDVLS